MSRVVLYIAASLDGYIATTDGGVGWLDDYADGMAGFDAFMSSISAVAMGRATYDFSMDNPPWRLGSMPTAVLTHRPIDSPPQGVFAHQGPVSNLVSRLKEQAARLDSTTTLGQAMPGQENRSSAESTTGSNQ